MTRMESDQLNRIALLVTVLACLYVVGTVTVEFGIPGLVGTTISLFVAAAVFVLWSRFRSR